MFSFIGCGGCEYVVRELKNANYKIWEGLDFELFHPIFGALGSGTIPALLYLTKKPQE